MSSQHLEMPVDAPEGRIRMSTNPSYDATLPKRNKSITAPEYRAFQRAYDFFNTRLFDGSLPHVLVTLQRRAHTRGYFSPDRFLGTQRSPQGARAGLES